MPHLGFSRFALPLFLTYEPWALGLPFFFLFLADAQSQSAYIDLISRLLRPDYLNGHIDT
jgi:hypothetical protein